MKTNSIQKLEKRFIAEDEDAGRRPEEEISDIVINDKNEEENASYTP